MNGEGKLRVSLMRAGIPSYDWHDFDGQVKKNPEVRKQAFFWLGQSHDPRALSYIENVLTK